MLNKRSKRGLNFRKFEGGHFRSWRLAAGLAIFFMVTKATGASDSTFECCPGSAIGVNAPECSDGSSIRIDCGEYRFYILEEASNPNDKFYIDKQRQTLTELRRGYKTSPKHRFCVSGKNSTRYFALACFNNHIDNPRWKHTLDGVLMIISGIFSILTSMVYFMLPELRSIQDKSIMCMVIFQTLTYFVGAIGHLIAMEEGLETICLPYAIVSYWLVVCSYFWLNLVSFNIWRSVWFKKFGINDKNLFRIFCAIVFVGPGLMIIVSLVNNYTDGDHLKPGFGKNSCWFSGFPAQWVYLFRPLAVLVMLNLVYLTLTCWRFWMYNKVHAGEQLKSSRINCLIYLKLFIVMGFLWMFEIMTAYDAITGVQLWPWIITDYLNDLQGVIMFVLLVATRRRVKKLLSKKHPCGLSFPKSWADYDDNNEDVIPIAHLSLECVTAP